MRNKKKFISDEYGFRSNFIEIQNHDFHYVDEGTGDPILMIHGGLTWSFYYRNLITVLSAQGNRVLAPDLMGFGFSECSRKFDYTIQNQTKVLIEFVEQLDLENITLVFHGMGMIPALGMAVNLPSRFKRIIALNGIAFTTPSFHALRILKHIPLLSPLFIRSSNLLLKCLYHKFNKSIRKESIQSYLFPNYSYESRIALQAFFRDAPFLYRSSSYGLVNNILVDIKRLSSLDWYVVNASQVKFISSRELKKWHKCFHWATFKTFPEDNHFMLEHVDSTVIKYITEIMK